MPEPPHNLAVPFDDTDEYRPEPPPPPLVPSWQDGRIRIGVNSSIAGDIVHCLDLARDWGANALQIFTVSPRSWPMGAASRIAPVDAQRFRVRREELRLGPVVVHATYLINLAAVNPVLRARSIHAFHDELLRCVALGADYLVVHPGSARDSHPQQGVADVADALRRAARNLKLGHLRILLENTAGQGALLGARLEELAAIIRACSLAKNISPSTPELRLGVCLDTAHLLAAGYDIRSADGLERTLMAIERTVGLRRVYVMHMNDSKSPLGSRVDRHEHIGKGHIGLDAFRRILNHPLVVTPFDESKPGLGRIGRAFILETPNERPGDNTRNVRMLWSLAGGPPAGLAPAKKGARNGSRVKAKSKRKPARRKPAVKTRMKKKPGKKKSR